MVLKKIIKQIIANSIIKTSIKMAKLSCGNASQFSFKQPKIPTDLKKRLGK